ncbi:NfeD family protein [Amphritea japonica]|uniref:NfeD-like C-terminal domain-containing protein n=1 Tax=Amphritea japonica ATCC BAA-1530 TaxID=1278309 RepID=A0A7R6PFR7_9GAMM|nr:NfeD family protein [Amphritea japonica]BBB27446.1 conserved hypothetical protein [Amphritea japonica ATCC BAA-1530]
MADWFNELTHWHWLTLGMLLLTLEVLGTSGFLIGLAVAALVVAGAVALDLVNSWQYQVLWFALLGIVFTILYWRVFRAFNRQSDEPMLNDRAAQLIGRRFRLEKDFDHGQGRVQIGDTLWKAEAEGSLAAGASVEVYGSEGMVLKIRLLPDS